MSTVDNTDMATISRAHFEFLDYTEKGINREATPVRT